MQNRIQQNLKQQQLQLLLKPHNKNKAGDSPAFIF